MIRFLTKPIYSPAELVAISFFTMLMPSTWWSWAILVAFFLASSAVEMMDPREP